jgi:glucan endo-1,3-alpha-glucosidase
LAARALGIDGFALNIGDDPWQPTQVAYAYGAAANLFNAGNGTTPFYLFISFDMTIISDPTTIVGYIQEYHGHSNQLVYEGKDFVSTFSGEYVYFGQDNLNDAWQIDVKDVLAGSGIEIYFVPSWSALAPQGVFDAYPVLDGIFCWTAWYFLPSYLVAHNIVGQMVIQR